MGWQQIVMIVLMALDLFIGFVMDGRPKDTKYSFLAAIVSDGIILFLLISGGFFK